MLEFNFASEQARGPNLCKEHYSPILFRKTCGLCAFGISAMCNTISSLEALLC